MKRSMLSAVVLAAASLLQAQAPSRLEGSVVTREGVPIGGARVAPGSGGAATRTDARGRFALEWKGGPEVVLVVEADGFERNVFRGTATDPLRIVLSPLSYGDAVTVTASRVPTRVRETPASVLFLSAEDFESAAALPVDAVLRQVPGFTLFRRSDSRTANPTTQGASLRGVGASGASRALVLDDGIPLNDPFGGWVSWGRVVGEALDRVEVLRGGSSDRYGAPALSGVIQMVRREPSDPFLSAEVSYGSEETADAAVFASARSGSWTARLAAEAFRTSGYVLLPSELSGPVDVPVASRHETADATLERLEPEGRLFLRGSYFDDDRGNGTPLQENDTRLWQLAGGAEGGLAAGTYSLRLYGLREIYHQTFTSVSPDRTEETLTRRQEVPSSAGGLTGQWERAAGRHRILFGLEGRIVSGASNEVVGAAGDAISDSGGRQATGAAFVQDIVSLSPRLTAAVSVRFDGWTNFDAFRRLGPRGSAPPETPLPSRSADAWSPRLGVSYQASRSLSLIGSAYRSFRAPTLNELYRTFRLGNTVTLANEKLGPERLRGFEIGGLFAPSPGALSARATAFWMEIDGTIANRTVSVTPTLITRQRQNLGRTRSRGLEVDLEARALGWLTASAGYLFADSTVVRFSDDPTIEGRRIPQVPRHQATLQVRADFETLRLAVQARYGGAQFEDDLNTLRLPGFVSLDARAALRLSNAVEVFAAGENLTGHRAVVARTPLTSLGPPRQVRGGVRLRLE